MKISPLPSIWKVVPKKAICTYFFFNNINCKNFETINIWSLDFNLYNGKIPTMW